jgi:hypothetical protein
MKYIEKIFLLIVLLGFGLSSCTVDEPIIVTPKTIDQYIDQFGKFVKAEKNFVDSCKVSYKKGDFAVLSTSSFASYKAAYLAALKADSTIIFTPGVTIAQIVAGNFSLAIPGKAFRAKTNIADLRELNDSIVSATNFNNTVLITSVLQYDRTQYLNAIAIAIATRDALTTIDRQVQTALASLKTAKGTFKAAILPTDLPTFISNSATYISAQLLIANSSIAGYNLGEYLPTLRANYLAVLQNSQTTVQTAGVTYTQAVTAMNNLVAARTAFIANVADKRDLRAAITADSLLNTQLTVGNADGQISLAVQTNLKNYIATGVSTRDNPIATDGTTKAIRYSLTAYYDATKASIPLNIAIVNANILNTSKIVGTATGQVSQGVKSTFTTAITAAIAVRDLKTSTADQMTTALTTLTKSQLDFVNSLNK